MQRHAFAIAFIAGLLVVGSGSRGQDEVQRSREALASLSKEGSLRPILQVLDKAKLSGSLEFSGRCASFRVQDFPDFPKFRAPATSGGSPLQTLREMFADDPAMRVMQDPDGTIRMIEKGVSTDILNVKIDRIPFESGRPPAPHPIYGANIALTHILAAPEVKLFMKAHDIEWGPVFGPLSGIVGGKIPPEVPHLSGPLYDSTFSEAMDYVLKAFPGIWIYENCPRSATKKRLVYFHFFYLQELGTGEEYVQ
jgi:hypothetical protein